MLAKRGEMGTLEIQRLKADAKMKLELSRYDVLETKLKCSETRNKNTSRWRAVTRRT